LKPSTRLRVSASLLTIALALADITLATAQPPLPPGARHRFGSLDLRHKDTITAVGLPAGGKTLVSCGSGHDVVLWDLHTGKQLRRYHQGTLLAVSPDGKWLALRAGWHELHVVETAGGEARSVCGTGTEWIFSAAFSADGGTVFVGGSERNVRAFDAATAKEVRRFRPQAAGAVYHLWLSADDRTCFTLSDYGPSNLQVWDAATGRPRRQLRDLGNSAAVTRDGKTVIACRNGDVIVWNPATGKVTKSLRASEHAVLILGVAPDGKTLALRDSSNTLRVFDLSAEKAVERWSVPGPVQAVAFSADGKTLAAGGWRHSVRVWDCHTGKEHFDDGHHAAVGALVFASDGRTLVSLGSDHTIRAWGLAAGKETRRWDWQGSEGPRGGLVAFPDGRSLAFGSTFEQVRVLDLATGKERLCATTPRGTTPVALAADGTGLLTVNHYKEGHTCTLWAMPQARKVRDHTHTHKGAEAGGVAAAAIAPDGKTLASLSVHCRWAEMYRVQVAHSLSLWDAATGAERRLDDFRPLPARGYFDGQPPWMVTFLDGGKTLVSVVREGGDDALVQFWDVATLKLQRTLRVPDAGWCAPAFSPDGALFATTGGRDGSEVCVWRTATGKQVQCFSGHRGRVAVLVFAPDGRTLASGSDDTTILVWELVGLR
jgi:WD40 repeat protein